MGLERPVNLPVPVDLNDGEFALIMEEVVLPRLRRYAPTHHRRP